MVTNHLKQTCRWGYFLFGKFIHVQIFPFPENTGLLDVCVHVVLVGRTASTAYIEEVFIFIVCIYANIIR